MAILNQDKFDQKILQLVNKERSSAGLKGLSLSQKLDQAADGYSKRMATGDFFSHNDPQTGTSAGDRIEAAGYTGWSTWGENIAAGQTTPEDVVQGWMRSSGHRANILNPNFTHMGLGYHLLTNDTGQVNYSHYWTQVFGAGANSGNYVAQTDNSPTPTPSASPTPTPSASPTTTLSASPTTTLSPVPNSKQIDGTRGRDRLTGGAVDDTIRGFAGNDVLNGKGGNDVVLGGSGNDIVIGETGNDRVYGGSNNDRVYAGAGNDRVEGGKGNDLLIGGKGNDSLYGGNSRDRLIGVLARESNPGAKDIDEMTGGNGADTFVLGDKQNVYYADDPATPNYVIIRDFNPNEGDVLELRGKASDYSLGSAPQGLNGTALIYEGGNSKEIIGVIQETTNFSLSGDEVRHV